jgi:pyruvate/2-oxoglutarate dehydrogenase complex dihydrolipoamide dehydrogenase (E3) component
VILVQSAGYEKRITAETPCRHWLLLHHIVRSRGLPTRIRSVGLTEEQSAPGPDCLAGVVSYADMDRAVIDDHVVGFVLIVSQETHCVLGAHVVGEQALEVIAGRSQHVRDMWVEWLAGQALSNLYRHHWAGGRKLVGPGVMPLTLSGGAR